MKGTDNNYMDFQMTDFAINGADGDSDIYYVAKVNSYGIPDTWTYYESEKISALFGSTRCSDMQEDALVYENVELSISDWTITRGDYAFEPDSQEYQLDA